MAAWLRLDARRRARSLVVVTVLLGLAGGLVFAVTAGARRDGSAMQRLRAESLPATAVVCPTSRIRLGRDPRVAGGRRGGGVAVEELDLRDRGDDQQPRHTTRRFPAASPGAYVDVERGAVLEGRRLDNSKVDEAIASEPLMDKYDLQVGDTLTARMFTPAQLDAYSQRLSVPTRVRPRTHATTAIVGVVRTPWTFEYQGDADLGIIASNAFFQKYGRFWAPTDDPFINALVRLRHGQSDLPLFQIGPRPGHRPQRHRGHRSHRELETASPTRRRSSVTHCCVFALCAAIAPCSSSARRSCGYTSSAVSDLDVLRALGMTRA